MSASVLFQRVSLPLSAAAILFALTSTSHASINRAGFVDHSPQVRRCSGAFRHAARLGNVDIVELTPVQVFARERQLARSRYTARAMYAAERSETSWHALTAMCGAR